MLLLVLVVVALFTLSAFTFYDLMFNYRQATDTFGSQVQAMAAAESGVEFILNHLNKAPLDIELAGGTYHNPAWFQGVPVVDDEDPRRRARFAVLAPAQTNGVLGDVRFGLENESARINLNALLEIDKQQEGKARDLLLYLPGMTELIADAILDWIDADDQPREFGAEAEAYMSQNPPYAPANAPLQTIEELLLVQGVTPELLYGADVNRNFIVDQDEVARQSLTTADNSDGSMNRGWSAFFTLHSAESNIRVDGTPKIDVNSADLATLHEDLLAVLDEAEANFIIAYRLGGTEAADDDDERGGGGQGGGQSGGEGQGGGQGGGGGRGGGQGGGGGRGGQGGQSEGQDQGGQGGGRGGDGEQQGPGGQGGGQGPGGGQGQQPPRDVEPASLDFGDLAGAQGRQNLTTILDLIGVTVLYTPQDSTQAVRVESPFSEELGDMSRYLPLLMENITVNSATSIPGRISINQAPLAILYGIPGLRPDQVAQIVANRDLEVLPERPERAYETWILTEGIVTLDEMKALMPFITGGGSVYRAQVVGFFDEGGTMSRIEVIVDGTAPGESKMIFWRDLTKLGGGFTPAALGAQAAPVVP